MNDEPLIDAYAVIGHPISHSLSPWIHSQFALQTAQPIQYTSIDVAPDGLENFLSSAPLAGLNVTLPHKQRVFELMDTVSDRATVAGAVNTVSRLAAHSLAGATTDGPGLIADL